MRDPTRRPPGAWPRDRPIRWRAVAERLSWIVVGTAAAIVQLALVIPLLGVVGSPAGDGLGGFVRIALALVWGGLTLFAGWSWLFNRWRIVVAPAVTVAALVFASTVFGT